MRTVNTLSLGETERLFNVAMIAVLSLGQVVQSTYISIMIPIITLTVTAKQINLVSICLKLKERAVKTTLLPLTEGNFTSNPKKLRFSKYS
jgi:hypothetical protein